jgi:hypothetical protein
MAKRTITNLKKQQTLVADAFVVAFEHPEAVISWIETLQHADSVGRIKKSRMSALTYGLYHYTQSRIRTTVDLPAHVVCTIVVLDDQAVVLSLLELGPDGKPNGQSLTWPEVWPEWIFEFFDDEDYAALLHPSNTDKILEVTQEMYEFCLEAGYLKLPASR